MPITKKKNKKRQKINTALGHTIQLGRASQVVIWRDINNTNVYSKYQIIKKKSFTVSLLFNWINLCIKMSPLKYSLHSLHWRGLIVKKQPAWLVHHREEPSSNDGFLGGFFFLLFQQRNQSQWIMGLSVAITCFSSTSWAKYSWKNSHFVHFFLSSSLMAKVQIRNQNRTPVSEFPFRTCTLLLRSVKQSNFHARLGSQGSKKGTSYCIYFPILPWKVSGQNSTTSKLE